VGVAALGLVVLSARAEDPKSEEAYRKKWKKALRPYLL
jgi:hypothetical protein